MLRSSFNPLLVRKAEGDRIRAVAELIGRHRHVLSIIGTLKTCIRNQDYDRVLHVYRKLKGISIDKSGLGSSKDIAAARLVAGHLSSPPHAGSTAGHAHSSVNGVSAAAGPTAVSASESGDRAAAASGMATGLLERVIAQAHALVAQVRKDLFNKLDHPGT